jgi:hypothetical protein
MNTDLLQKYLLETREFLFSPELDCPKQLLQSDAHLGHGAESEIEQLNFVSPEQMTAYRDLKEVVLPGQLRTELIEFLLEVYEPGILEEFDSQENRIETPLKQLGIWNAGSGGKKNQLDQIIGFFDSIQLLWKLCKLVKQSLKVAEMPTAKSSLDKQLANCDAFMSHICTN